MQLNRILRQGFIELDLATGSPVDEASEGREAIAERTRRRRAVEALLRTLVERLPDGVVGNRNQLLRDLWNREKKASTALGYGIAMPHVRTMQAKRAVMGFARLIEPLEMDTPDDEPVRLIFLIVGPPYDDKTYLRIYKTLGVLLQHESVREQLLEARTEGEILRALR